MKKAYLELTEEQKRKLFPIQDALMESNLKGAPGMVIAQISFTGTDAVAVVGFIHKEKADKIIKAANPKSSGNLMTDKMVRHRLAKARAK